jgi:hypothetical protein
MNRDETKDRLRETVTRHRVYWRVWPEWAILHGRREQVGFRLELYGMHMAGCRPTPGCEDCREVYSKLREIAAWILPREQRDSNYEVLSFDAALHYDSLAQNPGSVVLAILIVRRGTYEQPTDACQVRCLREMQDRLRELGAAPDRPSAEPWDSKRTVPVA